MNKRTCVLLGIFFIVLLGSFYVKNHEGDVFTFIAQRCFRQNDMLKAQFYYEKAFDTGVVDSRHRNIYVNSIINSPLTTDAQEKLVKFLDYPVDVCLSGINARQGKERSDIPWIEMEEDEKPWKYHLLPKTQKSSA